jgi:catechol 2,3-dioxygenase-like lactoylglutathione lyase family enzyme
LRSCTSDGQLGRVHVELVSVIVGDYDEAITFFVDKLRFDLVEDSPALSNSGQPKRWIVVRPPHAGTGLVLAQAVGDEQRSVIGRQHAGRVGFFLRVDDFDTEYERMTSVGVEFLTEPRDAPYGRFAVFRDVAGNRWDLLGPCA